MLAELILSLTAALSPADNGPVRPNVGDLLKPNTLVEQCQRLTDDEKRELCEEFFTPDPVEDEPEKPKYGRRTICAQTFSNPEKDIHAKCVPKRNVPFYGSIGAHVLVIKRGTDYTKDPEKMCPGSTVCVVGQPPATPDPKIEYKDRTVCEQGGNVVDKPSDCPPPAEPVQPVEKDCPDCPTCSDRPENDDNNDSGLDFELYAGLGVLGFLPGGPHLNTEVGINFRVHPAFLVGAYAGVGIPFEDYDTETTEHAPNYEATSSGGHMVGTVLTDYVKEKSALMVRAGAKATWEPVKKKLGGLRIAVKTGYAGLMDRITRKREQRGWMQTQGGELVQEGDPSPIDLPGSDGYKRNDCFEVGMDLEGHVNIPNSSWSIFGTVGGSWLYDTDMQKHLGDLGGMAGARYRFGGSKDE